MEFVQAVSGSVTTEVFIAFIDRLLASLAPTEKAVLWMDNASIHNTVIAHLDGTRHCVLKNAPYSPDLNPIEIFFGAFKKRLQALRAIPDSLDELLLLIARTIRDTPPAEVRSEFEKVRNVYWVDVL